MAFNGLRSARHGRRHRMYRAGSARDHRHRSRRIDRVVYTY